MFTPESAAEYRELARDYKSTRLTDTVRGAQLLNRLAEARHTARLVTVDSLRLSDLTVAVRNPYLDLPQQAAVWGAMTGFLAALTLEPLPEPPVDPASLVDTECCQ